MRWCEGQWKTNKLVTVQNDHGEVVEARQVKTYHFCELNEGHEGSCECRCGAMDARDAAENAS